MAGTAILCDGFLVRRGVTVIVAAEAANRVGMAEIVGVGAPPDLEIGKNVVLVNGERRFTRGEDAGGVLTRDRGVFRLIERG